MKRLQELRQQIATARSVIMPLEVNLVETDHEFQAVVGTLSRQSMRLQAENRNSELEVELKDLREEWARITTTNNL
ncbi:MAG: hypothetical protein SAK29_17975 [Scytonema sp. PMC 1069.18]|nr:hypothetical protein [Scytonema sp. PMC 1069.18]MEC4881241.1 hypothetical protein [Scytonema sp. PMC 1070.18]